MARLGREGLWPKCLASTEPVPVRLRSVPMSPPCSRGAGRTGDPGCGRVPDPCCDPGLSRRGREAIIPISGMFGPATSSTRRPAVALRTSIDGSFEADCLSSGEPVLVGFWAGWCGPCRQVTPSREAIAVEGGEKAKSVKLSIDENPAAAAKRGVMPPEDEPLHRRRDRRDHRRRRADGRPRTRPRWPRRLTGTTLARRGARPPVPPTGTKADS